MGKMGGNDDWRRVKEWREEEEERLRRSCEGLKVEDRRWQMEKQS